MHNTVIARHTQDTIFELLFILPSLKPGVIVHIHDIYLPLDYGADTMHMGARQHTEQYLLAAVLYGNQDLEILWPTNYMSRNHHGQLRDGGRMKSSPGGSFWFRRRP